MFPGHADRSHDILVVDDNAADARLAMEALSGTKLSLRAHAARDGVEALAFLMREGPHANAPRPDLILLDLNLPKKDGYEVLRHIREHPDLRCIPVAILTTSRAEVDIARCYDLGANCVISKPVDWDQFVRVIGRTVSFWLVHSTLPTRKGTALRQNPIRVLLIEDNPGDARLVQEMLADEGDSDYALTTVTTLRAGIERLKADVFDTVLLDLSLPDGQAVETLGALRSQEGRRPILVLTGIKDDVLAANAMRQGAEDFLVKGQIDGPSLARAVRHAIERSRWRNYLDHLAHHDSLTKLPNRALFQDRLGQALEQARRSRQGLAVLFVDLDHFKSINDTLGHTVGDMLLECVAERLRSSVRASDTVARVGGDEFTLLVPDIGGVDDVVLVADKILSALRTPFLIGPHQVVTAASAGASLYPHDGEDAETLLKHADAAMYRAKQQGRNSVEFHSRPASTRFAGKGALAHGLRHAIEKRQLVLHYQPTIDPRGQVVGLEALVRWQHPDWGLIYPLQFIPVAEETGLILDIGDWVLRSACFDRRTWQDGSAQPPRLSINLSTRQLHQGKFLLEALGRTLTEFSLEPGCLEIEVTESAIERDETVALQTLRGVSDMGIGITIDDFGTGHSSLARLQQVPTRGVKIDRSFIHHLPGGADDMSLVTAMIAMGHGLNLSVLAEGVENGEQMDFLVARGIDLMQGYYIGKPMPAEACNSLLASQRLKRA
jgi:diguanylate cyclase (GGDEF)-like protein